MQRQRFPYKPPAFGTGSRSESSPRIKRSVYYWWWQYLRRNERYLRTCTSGSKGRLGALYSDWGDVRPDNFKAWWMEGERGVRLFANPTRDIWLRELDSVEGFEKGWDRNQLMLIAVPLTLPRVYLKKRFRTLLQRRHRGRPGKQYAKQSLARYRVASVPNMDALRKSLAVWDMRKAEPKMPLWRIAVKQNFMPSQHPNPTDDVLESGLKRKVLAAAVSRYYKNADKWIKGTARGVFPAKAD